MDSFLYDASTEAGRDRIIADLEETLRALEAEERDAAVAPVATKTILYCQACTDALKARTAKWTGSAAVRVATLGVVDRDGDLILPGALEPGGPVLVSDWGHSSTVGLGHAPPVGTATLEEVGDALMAYPVFDDSEEGRRTCAMVLMDKPDWSVTYRVTETRPPTAAERAQGCTRVIVRWIVSEVSPVAKGAGVATGVVSCCCGACDASGEKQRDAAIAGLERGLRNAEAVEAAEVKAAERARDRFIEQLERTVAAAEPVRGPCGRACDECAERATCPYAGAAAWGPNGARRVALEALADDVLRRGLEGLEEPEDDWDQGWDLDADDPPATSWPRWTM